MEKNRAAVGERERLITGIEMQVEAGQHLGLCPWDDHGMTSRMTVLTTYISDSLEETILNVSSTIIGV